VKEGEWAFPVWPAAINLNGSVPTPYIFDDRVNDREVAEKIMEVYKLSKKERKARGKKGREFMIKNLSNKIMCNEMIKGIEQTLENFKPRQRFNLHKII
jgi:hypothetical protein